MRASDRPNPFRDQLEIGIEIPHPGACTASLPDRPMSRDRNGRLHPGAVATLVDVAMGHAIGSQVRESEPFATVHLAIVLHSPDVHAPLIARGHSGPLVRGWQEAATGATVTDRQGTVVATAVGLFARRPPGDGEAPAAQIREQDRIGSMDEILQLRPSGDRLLFEVHGPLLNPDGVAHGGALAAALDGAMRMDLQTRGAGRLRALTLDVSYLSPGSPGLVELRAEVLRFGRAIHFARATAVLPDGRVVADATATYRQMG